MMRLIIGFIALCCSNISYAQSEFEVFQKSWDHFRNGDYKKANQEVDQLLSKDPENQILVANAHYLKSQLVSMTDASEALTHITRAREIYEEEGNTMGVQNARLIQIKLLLQENRLAEAGAELESPDDLILRDAGFTYHLQARLAFRQERFDDALVLGQKSLSAYEQNQDLGRAAQAQSHLGLYQILNGEKDKGFRTTLKAQAGITRDADTGHYYYTLINMILYQRLKNGIEAKNLIEIVEKRLADEPDADLQALLDFAQTHQ